MTSNKYMTPREVFMSCPLGVTLSALVEFCSRRVRATLDYCNPRAPQQITAGLGVKDREVSRPLKYTIDYLKESHGRPCATFQK